MTHHRTQSLGLLGLLLLGGLTGCAGAQLQSYPDRLGDGRGPGTYRLPEHPAFPAGAFDLTRLSLGRDGADLVVEAEFAQAIRRAGVFVTRDERRNLQPQTLDLYLRQDSPFPGRGEALPGRRLAFPPERGWHKVVVLSPTPRALRRVLAASTDLGDEVCVADRVRVRGKRLRARVPADCLGPWPVVALAAAVTATRFVASFDVVDGRNRPMALTMPVLAAGGECRLDEASGMACHISGCDPCGGHPQVLDVLDPLSGPPADLGDYDVESGRLARIPWIDVQGQPAGTNREASHGRSGS